MLPELIDEGRRVLLFSQFTSMLDLINRSLPRAPSTTWNFAAKRRIAKRRCDAFKAARCRCF